MPGPHRAWCSSVLLCDAWPSGVQDQYELQGKAAILLLGTQQPRAKQQASAEALADTVAASQSEEPLKPAEAVSGHPAGNGKLHAPYGPMS